MLLLFPVPDADAGDHVDVFCAVWDWSSDCHLLCRVRWSCQTQRGILRRLPTCSAPSFCKRCRCGQKAVGGQWETGEAGLTEESEGTFEMTPPLLVLFLYYLWIFCYVFINILLSKFSFMYLCISSKILSFTNTNFCAFLWKTYSALFLLQLYMNTHLMNQWLNGLNTWFIA